MKKHILLTGNPGVGKTTIIKKLAAEFRNAGGFYTEEIRESGVRKGFRIITLDGKEAVLAYKGKSSFRVGKYGVNIKNLENTGVRSVTESVNDECVDTIIIDEIGKMELFSDKFREAVTKALNSNKHVIGIIHRANIPFLKNIKERKDVEIIEITPENRDNLIERLKLTSIEIRHTPHDR